MKRRYLILLLMAVAVIGAKAQTKMILHQKSGGNIEVLLNELPVATYEGTELVITTQTVAKFPLSNLEKITFQNVATSVEAMKVLCKDGGPSLVYDLNGRLLMTVPAGQPVETSVLPSGMYIIRNNNNSYKIQK